MTGLPIAATGRQSLPIEALKAKRAPCRPTALIWTTASLAGEEMKTTVALEPSVVATMGSQAAITPADEDGPRA